jgi:hypothetical protein
MFRISSLIVTSPRTAGTVASPGRSSGRPKSKRVTALTGSGPISASVTPNAAAASPLNMFEPVRLTRAHRPRQYRANSSGDRNV